MKIGEDIILMNVDTEVLPQTCKEMESPKGNVEERGLQYILTLCCNLDGTSFFYSYSYS